MWGGIYKFREGNQSCGEAYCRAIQRGDQNFGMSVESVGDIEILAKRITKSISTQIFIFYFRESSYISATMNEALEKFVEEPKTNDWICAYAEK